LQLAKIDYATADEVTKTRLKVIGDHTRAVTYLISDGVTPSNVGRGYIVRRLIRRVVRNGRLLGMPAGAFTPKVAEVAVRLSGACDPAVARNARKVYAELEREELRFVETLEKGEALLDEFLTAACARCATGTKVWQ
jgi:alanyl-tRNA synthetase